MGKRLEQFGEVRIVDETNSFGLDFAKKTKSRFWGATPDEDVSFPSEIRQKIIVEPEKVKADLKITMLKSMQAKWLVFLCSHHPIMKA